MYKSIILSLILLVTPISLRADEESMTKDQIYPICAETWDQYGGQILALKERGISKETIIKAIIKEEKAKKIDHAYTVAVIAFINKLYADEAVSAQKEYDNVVNACTDYLYRKSKEKNS